MIKHKNQAFTIVELVVVMTILSLLWTIAFLNLNWYTSDARNSVRKSDIALIKNWLDAYQIKNSIYPDPTDSHQVNYKNTWVWQQWTFWIETKNKLLNISGDFIDPLTKNEYTYSILNSKKEYQLWAILEWSVTAFNDNTTYADSQNNNSAFIDWNYNSILTLVSTWWTDYLLALPSIISTNNDTDLENIITNNNFTYNNFSILPSSYSWTNINTNQPTNYNINDIVLFSWSINDLLQDETLKIDFLQKLQHTYWNSILWDKNKDLLNTYIDDDYLSDKANDFFDNVMKKSLNLKATSRSSKWDLPSDLRQIFATWSIYTKYWQTNGCDPNNITIKEFDDTTVFTWWKNSIANNTIYKLKDWDYVMRSWAPLRLNGTCSRLIWSKNTKIYTDTYWSSSYPISSWWKNIIISNLKIDWISNPLWVSHTWTYIWTYFNPSNSTIANVESYNFTYWILSQTQSDHNNYYYNLNLHDNLQYWIAIFLNNSILNRIITYNNNVNWIRLANAQNNILKNIITFNNPTWLSINLASNFNSVKNINAYNNNIWIQLWDTGTMLNNLNLYNNKTYWINLGWKYDSINNIVSYNNWSWWVYFWYTSTNNNLVNNALIYNNWSNWWVYYNYTTINNNIINNILSFNNNSYWINYRVLSTATWNNYYWDIQSFWNTSWSLYTWTYTWFWTWSNSDSIAQTLSLDSWKLTNTWTYSNDIIASPNINWWDSSIRWNQNLSVNWNETYNFWTNVKKQSRPIKYNWTWFEYFWTWISDYNSYMWVWEF